MQRKSNEKPLGGVTGRGFLPGQSGGPSTRSELSAKHRVPIRACKRRLMRVEELRQLMVVAG
jgi:hypothetical protein